jgi:hypothetical protein
MRKIYILYGLFIIFTMTSCEQWFDVSAKSELKGDDLLSNEQGFRDALIGCYASMSSANLYGSQLTMTYMDVLGQYYSTASTQLNSFQYAYSYTYSNSTEETRKDAIWKNLYNVVANVNSILDNIDNKQDVFPTGEYQLIKGEALGLRAFIHFDILRLFADSPSMDNGLNASAIPYVDKFTNNLYDRLTVNEVLNRIVSDLTESQKLLSTVDPYGPTHSNYDLENLTGVWKGREYRMNYYAVTALLARVLLYRGNADDKQNAYNAAVEVINSGLFPLITSADIKSSEDNAFVKENIFALEEKELKDNIVDNYFYVTNTNSNFLAISNANLNRIFPSTLNMDYRRQWWIETSGSYNILSKYNYSKRVPLLKISEMYLIAAETASDITTAGTQFNTLLYHRGLPNDNITTDNLKTKLLSEYAKEFIGEGQLFFTYKRLNNKVKPITMSPVSNSASIYILPLPAENSYFK